ncbi:MAG TPA: PAS domain-containing protein, partial [Chitinophagales bacterium]|nr:PAS domain-containing protein [Chitinophagales bacterium]
MSNKNSDYYFLRGGGEMGELIRAKDWSKTSLGDPKDWPQSLRTMVAVMLDNPFGMYIAWGSEYIQLYNDGYRPILGATKHPGALGISSRETFSEIWHIIASMFDGVMKGKAVGFPDFMLPLNRYGFTEECYFDFSYSPIRKDDGAVGGILVTVIETTHKKKTEDRLKESNQRFRNTMKQAPVGITILRGAQYMVEMANDAYLQLIGKKEAEFVGNPLFASLPEVEEAVHSLLDNVLNTGLPYHGNEVPVPLNRSGKQEVCYFDFIYHPLKEEDGNISGVIVAVNEVTEKVVTRKTIEESKRIYEAITQNTPDLIYVFDLNYRFSYANDALLKMWGRSWEDAIGKSLLEIGYEPWHAEMHEREIREIIATSKPIRGEVSFPHATLGKRIYDYILVPVFDQDG